ncbi:hypothetical protein [Neobacillus niacini]|uniref:hypothetical protein n=1 Tax=Neobacillus niacini TaxID=86668 RepID=UPI00203EEF72|nr:hypothetical protein [Neobacillus niacini]MCM3692206.1 hypothetical protein [Neobacillus niacini]
MEKNQQLTEYGKKLMELRNGLTDNVKKMMDSDVEFAETLEEFAIKLTVGNQEHTLHFNADLYTDLLELIDSQIKEYGSNE